MEYTERDEFLESERQLDMMMNNPPDNTAFINDVLKAQHSAIASYDGIEADFAEVEKRIKAAQLPITVYYEDSSAHFVYKHGKCDSNTAYSLSEIINGLVRLYNTAWNE
jgi:hypothetical protein